MLRAVQPRVGFTPDFLTPPPKASRAKFSTELSRVRAAPLDLVKAELIRSRDELNNPEAAEIDRMLADPAGSRERFADQIESAWVALIEPDWPTISRLLEDDIAYRGQQVTSGGLAQLFDDLHPTLSWEGDRLVVARYREPDHELTGQGLLLVPGAFAWATVAEHLAALHDAGLAARRRTGHQVHYRRTEVGQAVVDASVG